MTKFTNGPARGATLFLRQAPAMLRVLQSIVIAANIDTAGRLDMCDLHEARALLRAVEG